MLAFLIPIVTKLLAAVAHHAAAASAHHVVAAAAAHSSPHVLTQAGGHLGQTTLQVAIAATIINATTMAVIQFCNDVHAYRERNHLDPYGHRKQELTDVKRCTECSSCGDFNLMVDVKGENKQENLCMWSHRLETS
jgi:hypothetical protein